MRGTDVVVGECESESRTLWRALVPVAAVDVGGRVPD